MTPNLFLCVMKAFRPWTWFPHEAKPVNRLHYQSEPVPGIYLVNREGHYLVAMKPNGRSHDAKLFKDQIALNEHEAAVYMEESHNSYTPWFINSDATAWTASRVCTAQRLHSATNPSSNESISSVDTSTARKVRFQLPAPPPRRDPYNPRAKIYQKSPLRQCMNARDVPGDPADATSRGHRHHHHSHLNNHHKNDYPVRSIDTVGFRYLIRPLQVEFSPYLQRWVFTAELQKRTAIANICVGAQCTHRTDESCEKNKAAKQFTCLDDGRTWLLTGDVAKNGSVKKRKRAVRDTSPLYTIMGGETMRMLDDNESERKRQILETCEGRFLRWKNEPKEYARAIKYVQRRLLLC